MEKVKTRGDLEYEASLTEIGGQGVFIKELEEALLAGTIDMAVHSVKDMPAVISPRLKLAAITKRVDAGDVLISGTGRGLMELPSGAMIGTGSQRRAVQLRTCRPDLQVHPIRGNVDTRLRKTYSGEFDGVILAAAALIRLGWQDKITEYLSMESFLPAVGQGALAIEIRADDAEMAELVLPLNHESTWQSVLAERAFLYHLGGGCRAPIAALGVVDGDILELQGMVASADGSRILQDKQEGQADAPEQAGRLLAQKMLQRGAHQLLKEDDR
jgi:hydroxymethylbilane synthase